MRIYLTSRTKIRLLLFFLTALTLSCKQSIMNDESMQKSVTNNLNTTPKPIHKIELKVIKSANAKYKVKNVKTATKNIQKLAKNYGGYTSNLQYENDLYRIRNQFTIKMPKANFEIFLDSIHNYIEFVDFESISTKDVTAEYLDIEARLKTKIEVKERYESILRKKATTVDEVLNTEEKIRVIQEEIEAAKGKIKYLKNKVAFSTIDIELYEEVDYKPNPVVYKKSFMSKIKEGFLNGSTILGNLFLGLINIWPFIILLIGVFITYKRRKSKS